MTLPATGSLVIMANAAYADAPFDRWLAGCGLELTILTATEFADGYRHCGRVEAFDNYSSNENVTLAAEQILGSSSRCNLFAHAEVDILRAARLRERHGLIGQLPRSAHAFRDKLAMKASAAAAGINVPEYAPARDALDLADFIAMHGYPVVFKPTDGSGSVDTAILRNVEDMKCAVDTFPSRTMEVERFVDGEMLHVDGLFADGRIVYSCVARYLNSCMSWMKDEFIGSNALSRGDPLRARAEAFARDVMASLPDPGIAAFHLELFHTPENELVFCEIASRTGGGLIARQIELTTGRHPTRDWVRLLVGLPCATPLDHEKAGGLVQLPPQKGRLVTLPDLSDMSGVVERFVKGVPGQHFDGGTKSGHYLVGYLLTASTPQRVEERILEIAAAHADRVVWQL